MLQRIPKAITTTQLQRNPKVIDELVKKGIQGVIIKESRQIGIFTPIDVYNDFLTEIENLKKHRKAKDLKNKLQKDIDRIKLLAGGIKEEFKYTPQELNDIFDKSYEVLP